MELGFPCAPMVNVDLVRAGAVAPEDNLSIWFWILGLVGCDLSIGRCLYLLVAFGQIPLPHYGGVFG